MKTPLRLNSDQFDWDHQANSLPASVTVNGRTIETARLSSDARRLLAVYLSDQVIVGQQEEILSLAKLGLIELGNRVLELSS